MHAKKWKSPPNQSTYLTIHKKLVTHVESHTSAVSLLKKSNQQTNKQTHTQNNSQIQHLMVHVYMYTIFKS